MTVKEKRLCADDIDFSALHDDVKNYAEESGITIASISESFYRSPNYLNCVFNTKSISERLYNALCERCGLNACDYTRQKKTIVAQNNAVSGYSCKCDVDVEKKITKFWLYKDGVAITSAFAHLKSASEQDVAQSISYAAHMAYKNIEKFEMFKKHNGGKDNG